MGEKSSKRRVPKTGDHLVALRRRVGRMPTLSGVYLMKDAAGEVVYVGKAKDLRARVRNYFGDGDGRLQIGALMRRVAVIDHIVCENERQAFLLERDLISKFKPRYNIRLKDDKAYLSVRIDRRRPWPRLELVRRRYDDGADYFGPFTFGYELRQVLEVIRKVIPLRSCSDAVLYNRQRPCLEYQIKHCCGPCCLPVDEGEYQEWVGHAVAILEGRTAKTLKVLERKMEEAAAALRFEEAAALRDRIDVLDKFSQGHRLVFHKGESRDAIGFFREGENAVISVLKVRSGRITDTVNYPLEGILVDDQEVFEVALSQLYLSDEDTPDDVLLPRRLPATEDFASLKGGESLDLPNFIVPQRGSALRLVKLAELNAQQYFASHFDADLRYSKVAERLVALLDLPSTPRRLECVDISNFQGADVVGAIVVFFDGQPRRSEFRRYRISTSGKQDDFAAIHESVLRRLRRGKEHDDLPDLLIIDGGRGQLASALAARDELGLELPIVALAKMRTESDVTSDVINRSNERIFLPDSDAPILLQPHDEITHLLQRIRDEVHEYVITFHRHTRGRRLTKSILDEVGGIGAERKRRLLRTFGSLTAMREASIEELAKGGRMPRPLAEKLQLVLKRGES